MILKKNPYVVYIYVEIFKGYNIFMYETTTKQFIDEIGSDRE